MIELPVSLQAWQFALSCALGGALGLLYDLLRGIRRKRRALTVPLDILFGLILLVSLLLHALYVGQGAFRLFLFPGLALGALLYFLVLSRMILRIWGSILGAIGKILRKMKKFCKKIFSFGVKWYKILQKNVAARLRRRKAGEPPCDPKGCPHCSS